MSGTWHTTGSERALDMLMKVRTSREMTGVTLQPERHSNTLVEAYTMQRFLQPEVLKATASSL